jgi:hypothetical protein
MALSRVGGSAGLEAEEKTPEGSDEQRFECDCRDDGGR